MAKGGRKRGSRSRGYWYCKGRGWLATCGTRRVPLTFPDGQRIRDKDADPNEVKQAFLRFQVAQGQRQAAAEAGQQALTQVHGTVTVGDVALAYLADVATTGSEKTHYSRATLSSTSARPSPHAFGPSGIVQGNRRRLHRPRLKL